MKRPKPGFKVFIKTRIRYPFKFTDDTLFEDGNGQRFRDVGSPHTLIFKTGLLFAAFMTLCCFNWTAAGFWLPVFAGVLILALHRFFRYFWTNFERVDEEGKIVEDKSLLIAVRRSKFEKWFVGADDDGGIKYCRYNWRQKVLIFFEIVILFVGIFIVPLITSGSPYSRLYTVELINPELPFITEIYSADGSVTVPDYDRGKIPLKDAGTLLKAYKEARAYIDTFCPEAEVTDYAVELNDGEILYHFTFKNFRRGLIYKGAYAIMDVNINADEDWMKVYYWSYYAIESAFSPVEPPDNEIDTERILGIIYKKAGKTKDDLEYYYIGTHSLTPGLEGNYDPGGDTWFAEVHFKGIPCILCIVNLADNTAAGVVRG